MKKGQKNQPFRSKEAGGRHSGLLYLSGALRPHLVQRRPVLAFLSDPAHVVLVFLRGK